MIPSIQISSVNYVAWFTAEGIDREVGGQRFFVRKCRICYKEITVHKVIVTEASTPEEIAQARADGRRDGEGFYSHLYVDHNEYFDDESEAVANFDPEAHVAPSFVDN
ncbi:MAG: hypothetical protein E6K18_07980 [Methanobacteriota archaeon]|nr:MAG: hypothetical protein E6K18_07980 [Euryarchaeota archaeon]